MKRNHTNLRQQDDCKDSLSVLKQKAEQAPETAGVYLFKDAKGRVLYVGKAVNLKRRVRSYLTRSHRLEPRLAAMVAQSRDLVFETTSNEAAALLLEAALIKKHRPPYNVELRDDKSYPYIEITGEAYPRVGVVRPRRKDPRCRYYGPYVNAKLVREALVVLRHIFPFRTCHPLPQKDCLDHHIGLCDAPCIGGISKQEYARNIRNLVMILEGRRETLMRRLQRRMESLARQQRYEEAAKVRDQIRALAGLYTGNREDNVYKELEQLQRVLRLPVRPQRIEAFDISTLMGTEAVGSMVSFLNGRPDKSQYRRFRIKTVAGMDDFKMIAEIVRRRYQRLKEEGRLFPQLILIDGGKGQLSAAQEALQDLGVSLPCVALAKREEKIFVPQRKDPIRLPPESLALKLLQRIRDEAHRFALSYHRLLRTKKLLHASGSRTKTSS